MNTQRSRRALSLIASLAGALALACSHRFAAAQGVDDMEQFKIPCPVDDQYIQPLMSGREVMGSSACFGCHSSGTKAYGKVDPAVIKIVGAEFLRKAEADNWVLGNEWSTWGGADRHAQAYTTLLGARSARIGANLGIAEIHRDARCLACHSSTPAATLQRKEFTIDAGLFTPDHVDERVRLGVNCEACHGAAGDNQGDGRKGWISDHVAKQTWRFQAPANKQSAFGFYDVRTPSSRARMCLSCHLGDVKQGRLVTHAMYAAGHPPLPNFEMNAFADMMPPHWRKLGSAETAEPIAADPQSLRGNKPKRITADFLAKTADPYFSDLRSNHKEYFDAIVANYDSSYAASRSLAVGALVAWSKNAELTSALMSDQEYPLIDHDDRWPELAQFECSACHHELRSSNWHRDRSEGPPPGRPLLRDWSAPLCRALLGALAPESVATFDERRRQIELAVATQPFGDRAELERQLTETREWLDGLTQQIEMRPFTRADALALLRGIAKAGSDELLDYDAARQLTWAFGGLLNEVDPNQQWKEPHQQFAALQKRFALDLATINVRKEAKFATPGGDGKSAFEIDLATLLPTMASHSAPDVKVAFGRLATAIAADPP